MIKNISKKYLATSLICLSLPTVVCADHHRGTYLEGNVGTLFSSVSLANHSLHALGLFGFNANVGYQFNDYLGIETGYTTYVGSSYLNNLDVMGKFIYPFQVNNNNYDVFAKLGAGYVFTSNYSSIVPMIGVGADYQVTPQWDLNIQAQTLTNFRYALGLVSFGATYHFG